MNGEIILPEPIIAFFKAHKAMCAKLAHAHLKFTLDGKLVGDIGEAVVADAFGISLCTARTPGIDGNAGGRKVQIKATGRANAGPAFSPGEGIADHLIFVRIDYDSGVATVIYNGPEAPVRALLPEQWHGTKEVRLTRIVAANEQVADSDRLARIK